MNVSVWIFSRGYVLPLYTKVLYISLLITSTFLFQSCSSDLNTDPTTDPPSIKSLRVNESVGGGHPHLADFIYPPTVNDETKAIVVIHGGGGLKHAFAHSLGFKKSEDETYNSDPNAVNGYNEQYLIDNNIALIFIQGLTIQEAPESYTWSNHIMTSGYDDKSMLIYFANYLKTVEGFEKVYLMGHSMGGVMTNRILCEAPLTFDGYGSSAGPISTVNSQDCDYSTDKPYIHVVGLNDRIIQIIEEPIIGNSVDHTDDEFLTLNSIVRGLSPDAFVTPAPEFKNGIPLYPTRVLEKCEDTVSDPIYEPNELNWEIKINTDCNGTLKLIQVKDTDHCTGAGTTGNNFKCDIPLTTTGQTNHLDRFVQFFLAN